MTEIESILEFDTAGDPMTGRKWCRMTLEKISACLADRLQITISATTVHRLFETVRLLAEDFPQVSQFGVGTGEEQAV